MSDQSPRRAPAKRASSAERRVEAAGLMLQRLTAGRTMEDLAKANGISERTVRRRIASAREGDALLDSVRAVLVQDMLPRSLAVLQEALDCDDLKLAVSVAFHIVDSLNLKAVAQPSPEAGAANARTEDSLELWRERLTLTRRVDEPPAVEALATEVSGEATEAVLVSAAPVDGPSGDAPAPAQDSPDSGSVSSQECLPFGSTEPDA